MWSLNGAFKGALNAIRRERKVLMRETIKCAMKLKIKREGLLLFPTSVELKEYRWIINLLHVHQLQILLLTKQRMVNFNNYSHSKGHGLGFE